MLEVLSPTSFVFFLLTEFAFQKVNTVVLVGVMLFPYFWWQKFKKMELVEQEHRKMVHL